MSSMFTSRTRLTAGILLTCLLMAVSVNAQYRLKLSSPDFTAYPKIQIPFEIIDNSSPIDTLRADAFRVFENGVEMLPVEVECGGYTVASKIHFMFLMDVSYSMEFFDGSTIKDPDSTKWRTAKRVFVESYQKLRASDEGGLASFAADFLYEEAFTSDKKTLEDATMGMRLRSGTAIYDAVVNAVQLLELKQGKRVIILLTDGVDNSSRNTLRQAVNLAWGRGIPVHIIGLGLYHDQNQPNRVDKDTLQMIANGTGGKAYFTAKSEELSEIFDRIIKSIYTVSCVARYTAPDTCQDGSARLVAVQATVKGTPLQESFVYTLPDLRSRLRLTTVFPSEMTHDKVYSIPLLADGEIRAGEPLSLDFSVSYDPSHFEYRGIEAGAGILDPADVLVTEPTAGDLRFSVQGVVPLRGLSYNSPEALLNLRFFLLRHETLATTTTSLNVQNATQHCGIVASGGMQAVEIIGCPENIELVLDTAIATSSGAEVLVPIYLHSDLDVQQSTHAVLTFVYGKQLEYLGYALKGTVFEGAQVIQTRDQGMVSFDISTAAPALRSGVLLYLRFRASREKVSTRAALSMLVPLFTQFASQSASYVCNPPIILTGADIWIDGICSPLVRRKAAAFINSVYPQPVSAEGEAVGIDFTVWGVDPIRLTAVDASGKEVGSIAEGSFSEGSHLVKWIPGQLTPGMYFIVLRQGASTDSRKILFTR